MYCTFNTNMTYYKMLIAIIQSVGCHQRADFPWKQCHCLRCYLPFERANSQSKNDISVYSSKKFHSAFLVSLPRFHVCTAAHIKCDTYFLYILYFSSVFLCFFFYLFRSTMTSAYVYEYVWETLNKNRIEVENIFQDWSRCRFIAAYCIPLHGHIALARH